MSTTLEAETLIPDESGAEVSARKGRGLHAPRGRLGPRGGAGLNDIAATMKICAHCRQAKPLPEFGNKRENPEGKGSYCRPCVNAKSAERRVRKPITARPCRHCGTVFSPAHRNVHYCSPDCRKTRQVTRMQELNQCWYAVNRVRRNAMNKAWKKANPERSHKHRADFYRRHKAEERAAHDAWVRQNRDRCAAAARDYYRRRSELESAMQGGKFRDSGFCLVRYAYKGEPFYRAVPTGRPVGTDETVLTRYEWFGDRWCVFAPAVPPRAHQSLVNALLRNKRFGKARRWKEAA